MLNNDNFRWNAVEGIRKIKDEISAKLNGMTRVERSQYFEMINAKYSHLQRQKV